MRKRASTQVVGSTEGEGEKQVGEGGGEAVGMLKSESNVGLNPKNPQP